LDGTIREQIVTRSVRAVTVSLVQLGADAGVTRTARPDGQGRYRVDLLPSGRYLMQIGTPTLDSLDLAMPAREVKIAGRERPVPTLCFRSAPSCATSCATAADLAKGPSRWRDACSMPTPRSHSPAPRSWRRGRMRQWRIHTKVATKRRSVVARTGAQGGYRLCGIPGGTSLALRLQHDGRTGPAVRLTISQDEGVVVRDLSISTRSAPTIALIDSIGRLGDPVTGDSSRGS
jgi:hypothetical protein